MTAIDLLSALVRIRVLVTLGIGGLLLLVLLRTFLTLLVLILRVLLPLLTWLVRLILLLICHDCLQTIRRRACLHTY